MTPIQRAMIETLLKDRHDPEKRAMLRRSLKIERLRRSDPHSRFHVLPEPQRRQDLRFQD